MSELKPCPFCGGEIGFDFEHDNFLCSGCFAVMPYRNEESVNTRPIEDTLRAEIERLKAERRWIPVSERLPGYYEFVNVYRKYGGRTSCSRSTCGDPAWLHFPFYDVTHWMPLPTPPEDE